MPHTITLRYRDALYEATVADLREGIPAMLLALNVGKFAFARLLRTRNEAEMALLDDLGWSPCPDTNGPFELTLPEPQLLHALHRIGQRSYEQLTRFTSKTTPSTTTRPSAPPPSGTSAPPRSATASSARSPRPCSRRPPPRRRDHARSKKTADRPDLHHVRAAIRELRVRRGLSQEQLGLHSGLYRNYVGAIERGEINPTLRTMLRLERGLGFTLAAIVLLFDQRRDEGGRP